MIVKTFSQLARNHPYIFKAYLFYLVLCVAYIIRIHLMIKTISKLTPQLKAKFCASIPDTKKWNPLLTYFGLAVLVPPRLIIVLFMAFCYMISAQFLLYKVNMNSLSGYLRVALLRKLGSFYTRIILVGLGFIMVKNERKTDIDWQKYPNIRKSSQKAPIIISNHLSFTDIAYTIYKYTPALISSIHVKSMPIVGIVATGLECVFLDRESRSSREATLSTIVSKVDEIQRNPKKAPLMIFPEGMTGKGGYIKPFKRGAFYSLAPITPLHFSYKAISYITSYYFFDFHDDLLLTMAEPFQMMTVTQMPTIEPTTTDYSKYCNDVYELYKNEFNMTAVEINLKERDQFIRKIINP